jgi:tRNA (Thr-GGU) A37 N-methylase
MHLNTGWAARVRPPRGLNAQHGVFATRSPHRPSQLALSALKLVRVDEEALTLTVRGVDLLDGDGVGGMVCGKRLEDRQ